MRWPVRVSRLMQILDAETPAEAVRRAIDAQHGEGWSAQIEEPAEDRDAPLLFPEYSRQVLETLYMDLSSAMRVAAVEASPLGDAEAVNKQIQNWVGKGQHLSEKATVMRKLRNFKGGATQ